MANIIFLLSIIFISSILGEKPINKAPYPPSGWKPEGASFELPKNPVEPSLEYLPSDQKKPFTSYGAPNFNLPTSDSSYNQYLPPASYANPQQTYGVPEQKYGVPNLRSEYGVPQEDNEEVYIDEAKDYSEDNNDRGQSIATAVASNGFQKYQKQKISYPIYLSQDTSDIRNGNRYY